MNHQALSSLVLVLFPLVMAALLFVRAVRPRAALVLVSAALVTTTIGIMEASWPSDATLAFDGMVRVDATARLFLGLVNPIFLGISAYIWHRAHTTPAVRDQVPRYVALSLVFLAAGNAVLVANHLIVLWILLEATTFAAAPLIVRPGSQRSQRASWRYLVFSSVGLGMVLLGFVCLERGMHAGHTQAGHMVAEPTFFVDQLLALGAQSGNDWTRVGLGLVLFGLGTKLGLAPMYTWLPEAYEEAPPAVTALLGSIQFNCALVVLFRVVQVYRPGNPALVESELLALGIATMTVSTVSIIATRNLSRLMAYASINHAGVIAIGLGVGKNAAYGLLLYVLSNAFIKTILFLTAGKITAFYGTRDTGAIAGLVKDLPFSGFFLMVGTFALLGFPPFGSFIGELLILSALVSSGQFLIMAAFCMLITATFVAMGRTVFPMIWGESKEPRHWPKQPFAAAVPKLVFLVALVVLGIYIPPTLNLLIQQVAATLGGT